MVEVELKRQILRICFSFTYNQRKHLTTGNFMGSYKSIEQIRHSENLCEIETIVIVKFILSYVVMEAVFLHASASHNCLSFLMVDTFADTLLMSYGIFSSLICSSIVMTAVYVFSDIFLQNPKHFLMEG